MSDSTQTENQATGSDLEELKNKATSLGLKFHPAMGAKKLQLLIDNHLAGENPVQANTPQVQTLTVSEITELQQLRAEKTERDLAAKQASKETTTQKDKRLKLEQSKLVRIRVTNMNPNKRDWEGEVYTVGNKLHTFTKYVPFNNDEGWHVPQLILNTMLAKECQIFYNKTDSRGNKTRHGKQIKELNIEIMDPLTIAELKELAQRQAMARGEAA